MLSVFTVIVTYNAKPWLSLCLDSLRKSSIANCAIVIDNSSTDETVSIIRSSYPEVILLEQSRNLGFGQANNIGIKEALSRGATHILLLNQDAWIEPDMLEKLLKHDDGKSLLSPLHCQGHSSELDANFCANSIRREGYDPANLPPTFDTFEIPAAIWLLPKQVVEQIGGFNPIFFHYSEDVNYLHRLKYHHIRRLVVSSAIGHHCRESREEQLPNAQRVYQCIALIRCNINETDIMNHWRVARYGLGLLHTAIAQSAPQLIGFYFQGLHRLRLVRKQISISRTTEKQLGKNWL